MLRVFYLLHPPCCPNVSSCRDHSPSQKQIDLHVSTFVSHNINCVQDAFHQWNKEFSDLLPSVSQHLFQRVEQRVLCIEAEVKAYLHNIALYPYLRLITVTFLNIRICDIMLVNTDSGCKVMVFIHHPLCITELYPVMAVFLFDCQ